MAERKKKQKIEDMPAPAYMTTYGDMVTLLLTFFVLMYSAETAKGEDVQVILSAFKGMGMMSGGNTLEEGKLAELGNTVDSLPSLEKGRSLSVCRRWKKAARCPMPANALSVNFKPTQKSKR